MMIANKYLNINLNMKSKRRSMDITSEPADNDSSLAAASSRAYSKFEEDVLNL